MLTVSWAQKEVTTSLGLTPTMAGGSSAHHLCVWKLQSSNELPLRGMGSVSPVGVWRPRLNTAVPWQWELARGKLEPLLALRWELGRRVPQQCAPQQKAAQTWGCHRTTRTARTRFTSQKQQAPKGMPPKDSYLASISNPVFTPHGTECHLWRWCRMQCESVWDITRQKLRRLFSDIVPPAVPPLPVTLTLLPRPVTGRDLSGPQAISGTQIWGCGFQGCRQHQTQISSL